MSDDHDRDPRYGVRRYVSSPRRPQAAWRLMLALTSATVACGEFKSVPDAAPDTTAVDTDGPDTRGSEAGSDAADMVDAARDDTTTAADSSSADATPADGPEDAADGGTLPADACALTVCGGACVDMQTDARHCGACGRDCAALPHVAPGAARCEAGACVVPSGTCIAGRADCNRDAADGCEADLLAPDTCGDCGRRCDAATPLCAAVGSPPRYMCVTGCDGAQVRCDDECIDTATDIRHCGACDRACAAPDHGRAVCVAGACGVACEAGYGNCDADAANGCEVDTRVAVAHCGACGRSCPPAVGGSATCTAGVCGQACPAGQSNCGGVCRVTGASCTAGAGACARTGVTACAGTDTACSATPGVVGTEVCNNVDDDCDGMTDEAPAASSCPARANAATTCAAGVCGFACGAAFADCDGDPTNGCEGPLSCATPGDRCTEGWSVLPRSASARRLGARCHWTGSSMLVWAGQNESNTDLETAIAFDPAANAWRDLASSPSPGGWDPATVWTGTEMLAWAAGTSLGGARYVPGEDRWRSISMAGAPPRTPTTTSVWTGREAVVFGVDCRSRALVAGRYDPATDRWRPAATTGAPLPRFGHVTVWTGSEMLIWGGQTCDPDRTFLGDGARYDPATDTWRPMAVAAALTPRRRAEAVWTGAEMLVWGGRTGDGPGQSFGDGARYDPVQDRWRPLTAAGAPAGRSSHIAVYTGQELVVWGGFDGTSARADGGAYDPATDRWRALPSSPSLVPAYHACAAWSGEDVLIGGGGTLSPTRPLTDQYRYHPPPPPPRPVAPLSTATVTSQRPTLRWAQRSACFGGARVEICRDRACTTVEQTLDVTGTSARPTADLAPGVHFWRVFGRRGTTTGTLASPTWEFVVGHRSAPVDTSWGTVADFNGDGYADVVVGGPFVVSGTGRAYIYHGSAAGLGTTPATTLTGPSGINSGFGESVASAGDVNGDGYADLVVGAPYTMSDLGRAYVYHGSAAGLGAVPTTTLTGRDGAGRFGVRAASAGDVNGDGYADVVVGAPFVVSNTGRAYVFPGGPGGLVTTPVTTLMGTDGAGSYFGVSVASAGDVNGDGYAEVAVGAYQALSQTGRGYVYQGSVRGLDAGPATLLTGPDGAGSRFGFAAPCAGDVNGDGHADLLVGAYQTMSNTGRAHVYLGSASGLDATPATTLIGRDGAGAGFGYSAASAGDVNGDGYSDIIIGANTAVSATGRAYVFLGSASGVETTPATTLTGPDGDGGEFGWAVVGAGDVNADGFHDLGVGARYALSRAGRSYLFAGSAAGLRTTAMSTLVSPDGGEFGASVASARDVHDDGTTAPHSREAPSRSTALPRSAMLAAKTEARAQIAGAPPPRIPAGVDRRVPGRPGGPAGGRNAAARDTRWTR